VSGSSPETAVLIARVGVKVLVGAELQWINEHAHDHDVTVIARGIDERPVEPDQPVQSISAEDTFATDLPLAELEPHIRRIAEKAWTATRKTDRVGRTVVLKLKTAQFRILTRSFTPDAPPASLEAFTQIALSLLGRVELPDTTRYRLVGVGLSGFRERDEIVMQAALFDADEPEETSGG
jgi:DNA polymerase IV